MNAAAPSHAPSHTPVMTNEVLAALAIAPGECYVDATYGAGSHTRMMLAAGAKVIALDRDPDAIAAGRSIEAQAKGNLMLIEGRFGELDQILAEHGIARASGARASGARIDGILFDIGVSSMQIDAAQRGFSFRHDGPLDMRMSRTGESAAEWLNRADEKDIADILYMYGEERQSYRIARAIVAQRPLSRTGELAALICRVLRRRGDSSYRFGSAPTHGKHPATRSFQAIRIYINSEMRELAKGLEAAERLLCPGGRVVVISFHSLEDRFVKQFFRMCSGMTPGASRHRPEKNNPAAPREPSFHRVSHKQRPSAVELAHNPRARSATLRSAIRTNAPAWPVRDLAHGGREC